MSVYYVTFRRSSEISIPVKTNNANSAKILARSRLAEQPESAWTVNEAHLIDVDGPLRDCEWPEQ